MVSFCMLQFCLFEAQETFASCKEPQLDIVALFATLDLPKSITPAICLLNTWHVSYLPLSHIIVFNYLPLIHIFQKLSKTHILCKAMSSNVQ